MKIVYVTGCLGFMGSKFTRLALKKGWFVSGIDKMTCVSDPKLLIEFEAYPNFRFEKEDKNIQSMEGIFPTASCGSFFWPRLDPVICQSV